MYVFYKKLLLIFVLVSISLIALSQETMEVQLVSISNIYNNNVSNKCSHDVTINEKTLTRYKSLNFTKSELNTLILKVNYIEFDEKYTDYGSNTKTIDPSTIKPK